MAKQIQSADGYYIGQGAMGDVPYGKSSVAKCGCGSLALYNLMRYLGRRTPYDEIRAYMLARSLFSGRLGGSPIRLYGYLKRQGLPLRLIIGWKQALKEADACRCGILLYRHKSGMHYVFFHPENGPAKGNPHRDGPAEERSEKDNPHRDEAQPDGLLHLYNDRYYEENDRICLSDFQKTRAKRFPFLLFLI